MIEELGNLWNYHPKDWIVITTNGTIKKNGSAVMGRGCAREAAIKYPNFPTELGRALSLEGNHVMVWPQYHIITFPVKHNWFEFANTELIRRSASELNRTVGLLVAKAGGPLRVYCPRFGAGNGKLDWEVVKRVVAPILSNNNFIILTQG